MKSNSLVLTLLGKMKQKCTVGHRIRNGHAHSSRNKPRLTFHANQSNYIMPILKNQLHCIDERKKAAMLALEKFEERASQKMRPFRIGTM